MMREISLCDRAAVIEWRPAFVTPTYFPSLSTTATTRKAHELLDMLVESAYPRILVSAYDLANFSIPRRRAALAKLKTYQDKGGLLFLDSGGYESFWFDDATWSIRDYQKISTKINADLYTTFDRTVHRGRATTVPNGYSTRDAAATLRTQTKGMPLILVHASKPSELVKHAVAAARHYPGAGIALPERECGPNVPARAAVVRKVRDALRDPRTFLHVLGCGHPLAIAAYVHAGADSFDSLDWSQTGIDPTRHDFTDLTLLGRLRCTCVVCKNITTDNVQRTLLHNLRFHQDFALRLHNMIRDNTLDDFLLEHLGRDYYPGG